MRLGQSVIAGALALGMGVTACALAAPTTLPVLPADPAPSLTSAADAKPLSFNDIGPAAKTPPPAPSAIEPQPANVIQPPTAPLPSAILAGPATMIVAAWIGWRIRRRGNRI